jgi:hypothetical protein
MEEFDTSNFESSFKFGSIVDGVCYIVGRKALISYALNKIGHFLLEQGYGFSIVPGYSHRNVSYLGVVEVY